MDETLLIRPADLDDINTIGFLAQQIWPDAYGEILSPEQLQYMLNLFYSPESLMKQMTEDRHQFLIVEQGEEAIGFAAWGPAGPGVVKLHKLYVLPGGQGKGIGRAMLLFIFDVLRSEGIATLRLNVNRHNKAKRFYEKAGFKITGKEDIDIGGGYFMNDFIMECPVPPSEFV
jgi:ribosomal protein S18 acetylase RimI-like enzyme